MLQAALKKFLAAWASLHAASANQKVPYFMSGYHGLSDATWVDVCAGTNTFLLMHMVASSNHYMQPFTSFLKE